MYSQAVTSDTRETIPRMQSRAISPAHDIYQCLQCVIHFLYMIRPVTHLNDKVTTRPTHLPNSTQLESSHRSHSTEESPSKPPHTRPRNTQHTMLQTRVIQTEAQPFQSLL